MNDGEDNTLRIDYAPPRFAWLRRGVFGVLYLICFLLIWRGVLACKHAYTSNAALEELAALKVPTLDELNARPKVPDEQNAAIVYRKAFALYDDDHSAYRNSIYDFPPRSKYPVLWYYLAAGSDERYQQMFALAHDAGKLPEAQWTERIDAKELIPSFTQSRALTAELADNAEYHHLLGNDRIALQRADDCLRLGRAVRQDLRIVSQLVGMGITGLAHSALSRMAAGLRVEDAEVAAHVRRIIADLEIDEAGLEQSAFRTLGTEAAGAPVYTPMFFGRPWFTRSLADANIADNRRELAAIARDWFAPARPLPVASRSGTIFGSSRTDPAVSFRVDFDSVPVIPTTEPARTSPAFDNAYARYRERVRRMVGSSRLLRVALAMRLYRHDHGDLPDSVARLVPAYLPSVPVSPCVAGSEVGFTILKGARPDGGDRPMIYLDGFTNANPPPTDYSPDYHVVRGPDRDGRQWRDVSVWPDAAYAPPENDKGSASAAGNNWGEVQPGFEASGLEPSEHSPRPEQDPGIPEEPW